MKRLAWGVAVIAASIGMTSCLLPVPVNKVVEGPAGEAKLDMQSLRQGKATRAELEQKLAPFKVERDDPGVYWARYTSSHMAVVWAVAGGYSADAGGFRTWGAHNLFIKFNEDGTVKEWTELPDDGLDSFVRAKMRTGDIAGPNLAEEIQLRASHRHNVRSKDNFNSAPVDIVLTPSEVRLVELTDNRHCFRFPAAGLLAMKPIGGIKNDPKPDPATVLRSVHFKDEKGKKHRWTLYVDARDLPTLIAYFDAVAQSSTTRTAENKK